MAISQISENAFAVLAICEKSKDTFGITIDSYGNRLKFVWAFTISKEKAHREKFDSQRVRGIIELDDNFNGCPHCKSKRFYICEYCDSIACYHGQRFVNCPSCGKKGEIRYVKNIEIKGGSF